MNPRSTLTELADVLRAYDAARPRSQQAHPGPSELGTPCLRQLAYKIIAAPRRATTSVAWAPFQGVAIHAEMEKVLTFWNAHCGYQRWIIEARVDCGDGITGTSDAYDADTRTVVDWKVTGATAITNLVAARNANKPLGEQVKHDYRVQAHLYGLGHANAGRSVEYVRLVFLARHHQYAASAEWTEPYNERIALAALDRYHLLRDAVLSLGDAAPRALPAVPADPGDACSWCPYLRPGAPADHQGCPGNS